MMRRDSNIPLIAKLLLAAMTVMMVICFANQPWGGDDLTYGYMLQERPLWKFPLACIRHWLHANGRMANNLAMLIMRDTPTWLIAVMNALVTTTFYWMILTIAHRGRKSAVMSVSVIALVLFTFCWWDSFFLFDVSLNYTWAASFGMIWAWWLISGKCISNKVLYALALLFAFMAGCMHEAMSLPLLAGVIVWQYIGKRWRSLNVQHKWLIIAFAVGALYVISSPGIWTRLGRGTPPDDPLPMLLLKSDWMVLLMIVLLGVMMIGAKTRKRVKDMVLTTDLPIWIVAALGSMAFSAVGGIVGRSGWFASTYALIAIVRVLYPYITLPKGASAAIVAVLMAASLFHLEEYARWQIVTGRETADVNNMYQADPTKPIYYDYTYIDEVPWWVLNKLRLVPDPDNFHEQKIMRLILGDKISPVVVLPTEVKEMDVKRLGVEGKLEVRHGYITLTPPERDTRNIATMADGRQYMVVSFKHDGLADSLYFVTPRQPNPGDR